MKLQRRDGDKTYRDQIGIAQREIKIERETKRESGRMLINKTVIDDCGDGRSAIEEFDGEEEVVVAAAAARREKEKLGSRVRESWTRLRRADDDD